MPTSNPLDILLTHDQWASRQILLACEKLSDEQFRRKFDIGPGSLAETMTHMVSVVRVWTDLLAERPLRPRLEHDGAAYSPAQLMQMLDEFYSELLTEAKKLPLESTIRRTREGKEYTFTRGAVLTHVTTHGMHHRAQCLNMLKQLGVSPLPPSSVVEWTFIADAG